MAVVPPVGSSAEVWVFPARGDKHTLKHGNISCVGNKSADFFKREIQPGAEMRLVEKGGIITHVCREQRNRRNYDLHTLRANIKGGLV